MIPIIDAHHHIWRQQDLPWLLGPMVPRIFGPYEAIRRDYLVEEYQEDFSQSNVVASVYIQVNWAAENAVEEVRWVNDVADASGWPTAIVGYANLLSEGAGDVLKAQSAFSRMRGIRMQLHWHENEMYRFAPEPNQMKHPLFRKNLAIIEDYGWSFDLQLFASQMADGAALANAFPNITFILQHSGMLEDDSPDSRNIWREGMKRLADCPNVVSKTSGLGTFIHKNSATHIKDIVDQTISLFGPERCIFGSNFPIEKLWTDYGSLVTAHRTALEGYSEEVQRAVLHDNAQRIYRLADT
ncbi:MAG: amidohydrolase family protein [Rhodospirillales bacterium]|nr:amidohydrolase family protein [Rhodospirillales bacterium]